MADETNILVLGDWVIYEYWFLVRHQSDISSHVGFNHYRLNDKKSQYIRDLCGAGHIIRLLFQYSMSHEKNYNISGIGIWDKRDNNLIKHLIHSHISETCEVASSVKSMTLRCCEDEIPVKIWTLDPDGNTIRVVRQYHMQNGGLKQISRIDWEPSKKIKIDLDPCNLEIINTQEITDIVIHDLNKGAVSKNLVKYIADKFTGANWYIRSKVDNPDWLEDINVNIKLRLIGPETASKYIPWKTWIPNKKITTQSIEYLDKINAQNIFLLTDNYEMVGKINDGQDCVIGKNKGLDNKIVLGWSSTIFAELILMLINNETANFRFTEQNIEEVFKSANCELSNFVKNSVISDDIEVDVAFEKLMISPTITGWDAEKLAWKRANQEYGLIGDEENLSLEIWRGSPCIPGYITCINKKQEILTRIGENIQIFIKNKNKQRSLSIHLQADPGSGKTFLASSLSKAFDLSILRFDVTQMIYRDELLDLALINFSATGVQA